MVEREGKNTPIQGTSADITKLALWYVHCALEPYGGRAMLVNTVHDEIIVEAPPDIIEEVCGLVVEQMELAAKAIITEVPVIAEGGYGDDWTVK